ncbi:MAG: hypothetical protein C5B43_01070 [Verrucomicrobia bacterium]|nr:MAG: hypothetical protein C5B43_01070 [Verrucomicrobiota bacterium]
MNLDCCCFLFMKRIADSDNGFKEILGVRKNATTVIIRNPKFQREVEVVQTNYLASVINYPDIVFENIFPRLFARIIIYCENKIPRYNTCDTKIENMLFLINFSRTCNENLLIVKKYIEFLAQSYENNDLLFEQNLNIYDKEDWIPFILIKAFGCDHYYSQLVIKKHLLRQESTYINDLNVLEESHFEPRILTNFKRVLGVMGKKVTDVEILNMVEYREQILNNENYKMQCKYLKHFGMLARNGFFDRRLALLEEILNYALMIYPGVEKFDSISKVEATLERVSALVSMFIEFANADLIDKSLSDKLSFLALKILREKNRAKFSTLNLVTILAEKNVLDSSNYYTRELLIYIVENLMNFDDPQYCTLYANAMGILLSAGLFNDINFNLLMGSVGKILDGAYTHCRNCPNDTVHFMNLFIAFAKARIFNTFLLRKLEPFIVLILKQRASFNKLGALKIIEHIENQGRHFFTESIMNGIFLVIENGNPNDFLELECIKVLDYYINSKSFNFNSELGFLVSQAYDRQINEFVNLNINSKIAKGTQIILDNKRIQKLKYFESVLIKVNPRGNKKISIINRLINKPLNGRVIKLLATLLVNDVDRDTFISSFEVIKNYSLNIVIDKKFSYRTCIIILEVMTDFLNVGFFKDYPVGEIMNIGKRFLCGFESTRNIDDFKIVLLGMFKALVIYKNSELSKEEIKFIQNFAKKASKRKLESVKVLGSSVLEEICKKNKI